MRFAHAHTHTQTCAWTKLKFRISFHAFTSAEWHNYVDIMAFFIIPVGIVVNSSELLLRTSHDVHFNFMKLNDFHHHDPPTIYLFVALLLVENLFSSFLTVKVFAQFFIASFMWIMMPQHETLYHSSHVPLLLHQQHQCMKIGCDFMFTFISIIHEMESGRA